MLISGILSAAAGALYLSTAHLATTHFDVFGRYAAFGALWYLISTIILTMRLRRS